jgi:hypothetical protein
LGGGSGVMMTVAICPKTPGNLRETRQNPPETCVKPVKTRPRDVTFPGFSGDFRLCSLTLLKKN